jgi:hypothetical protein
MILEALGKILFILFRAQNKLIKTHLTEKQIYLLCQTQQSNFDNCFQTKKWIQIHTHWSFRIKKYEAPNFKRDAAPMSNMGLNTTTV